MAVAFGVGQDSVAVEEDGFEGGGEGGASSRLGRGDWRERRRVAECQGEEEYSYVEIVIAQRGGLLFVYGNSC